MGCRIFNEMNHSELLEKLSQELQCDHLTATNLVDSAVKNGGAINYKGVKIHIFEDPSSIPANQDWINTFTKDLLELKKPDQKIFIETGSGNGDGIEAALEAGFTKIYSIELNDKLVECCRKRFEGKPVEIIHGSSCAELPSILKTTEAPFFLWLDAHFSEGAFIGEEMNIYLPKELAAIASLGINFENCSIAADDINHYIKDTDFIRLLKLLMSLIKKNAAPQIHHSSGGAHIFLTSIH